ncbi:hypothetical protein KI387_010835, partial [Taxus chinensis]
SDGDREIILSKLWELQNHYLLMKPWFPTFNPLTASFTVKPVWIRLPHLSLQFWGKESLTAIDNAL